MAIDMKKLFISGAIAGAITPFLLKYIVMPVLNFLGGFMPQFSLKLANPTVAINVRESLTGIQGGMAGWVLEMVGVSVPVNMWTTVLVTAVGGALMFVTGGIIADKLGFLSGSAMQKTTVVIFAGSIVAAVILGTLGLPPQFNITLVNLLLAFLVNAAMLSYVYSLVDGKAKIGLVPF